MKAKRIISILLALTLVLAAGLVLASCGGGDDTCTHVDANTDGKCDNCSEPFGSCTHEDSDDDGKCNKCGADVSAASGVAALISGGKANFQIVIGPNGREARGKAEAFASDISELVKNDVMVVNDLSTNVQDVEILFGSVNTRGDEYKIDEHYLGHKGFAVKIIGSKVQVLAGSASKYEDALEYLSETVMGIKRSTKELTELTATADQSYEELTPADNYLLTSAKIAGNNLDDYVIVVESGASFAHEIVVENLPETLAANIQTLFYQKLGVWLDIVEPDSAEATSKKAIEFNILSDSDESATEEGFHYYVTESGNLVFDCQFPDSFVEHTENYLYNTFILTKKKTVNVSATLDEKIDVRNIKYSDKRFGAVGDGITDDFFAIKECHDYANKWGHIVHADEGKTYFIGKNTEGETVEVQTDTFWHGSHFLVDDSKIAVHNNSIHYVYDSKGNYLYSNYCADCEARGASIFSVTPSKSGVDISSYFNGLSLNGGWGESDNTLKFENWPLDYTAIVDISTKARKIFIRYGANEDGGDHQHEILLVHPDGTIDPSTPLSYDYPYVTWAAAYYADDEAITIDGGGGTFTNIANIPEVNEYIAFARNINVTRSNVTVKNFEHILADEKLTRAPYAGILSVRSCNNVTFENILLQQHKARFEWKAGKWVGMGTYEIGGYAANNLNYINCDVKNFYGTGDPENCRDGDNGKMTGMSFRVPTNDVSVVDLTARLKNHEDIWGVGVGESAHILKPERIGEMVNGEKRLDALGEHIFDLPAVVKESFTRINAALRLDAAPFDAEAVDLQAHLDHEVDILAPAVVVVIGAHGGGAVLDLTFGGKACPVVVFITALDLGGGGRRAEKQALFELKFHENAPFFLSQGRR